MISESRNTSHELWTKHFFLHNPLFVVRVLTSAWLMIICFSASTVFASQEKWTEPLAQIAVQQGGRVKPFETFAREAVLYVTGRTLLNGQRATQTVWEWMSAPEKAATQPLIYVGAPQIRAEFGLKLINKRVSSEVVLSEKAFMDKTQEALSRREAKDTLSFVDKKHIEIYERALFLTQLGGGELPGWIADSQDPQGMWLRFADFSGEPLEWMRQLPKQEIEDFKSAAESFAILFKQSASSDAAKLDAAQNFSKALENVWSHAGITIDQNLLKKEIFYNQLHAFGRGAKLYLIALLFFGIALILRKKNSRGFGSLILGLILYIFSIGLHALGFYLRCVISGRAPVTNMYESIVWVSLAVAIFSLFIFNYLRHTTILAVSSMVAAIGLLIAESFPAVLDPAISPLVPVLRNNFWLTIHVLTITMSYGAFALAWGLGHAVVLGYALSSNKSANKAEWLAAVSSAVYRALQIGVILLASGTVLGGVWANYSWGRFWGWDPKETWALIALLGYLVVLHGRFIGWFGPFGIAMGAILAFVGVMMAWYGVNFVLAAGLHSYGFGGGGYPYVATFVLIDLVCVTLMAWKYKKK